MSKYFQLDSVPVMKTHLMMITTSERSFALILEVLHMKFYSFVRAKLMEIYYVILWSKKV